MICKTLKVKQEKNLKKGIDDFFNKKSLKTCRLIINAMF